MTPHPLPTAAPRTPAEIVRALLASTQVGAAFRFFETQAAAITDEQIAICSIPAPPFGEGERASYLREKFQQSGLSETQIDDEGNCVGVRRGRKVGEDAIVISAHLDTVFPPGTNCAVRHEAGGKLLAPGIADDSCGLAALLALLRALEDSRIETRSTILFVGTVGEEGEGNLRGVRHLLTRGEWAGRVNSFVSLDGPGTERITHVALGSRRYRVALRGSGGHSWGDFGIANPVHALGRAIARLAAYPVPASPRTTFNVGRVSGGAGVNVIPQEATMDVDLRSEAAEELQRLDAFFRRAVREAMDDENALRLPQTPPLKLDLQLIGDRPSGRTPSDAPLVSLAEEATRALGSRPVLDCSSTDANVPIALGIPAITIGAGGASSHSHTLHEWYDPRGRDLGLK
ncbi:MAG TPA: M20/M25/M40 family metallo-hydrolase, partial [Pyrinomonadaceae bacterium]|nr:M20/M25/M40 family metallo-hydrolase [Pyrinomonadaceae bacterium]